ncbi:MAG: T9SS type A sorting domain-containing protein [Bacteroidota bacterium]|jgi:hypothetical protein
MKKFYTIATATFLFFSSVSAQVSLTTSPYTENFNNLGTAGLPAGFSVKKLATATALGTDTILNSGVTPPWRAITRGFKNYASATSVTDPGTDSTTQAASPDRALGVRQTSAFGDSGAAFVFQISNTLAKKNFQLSFKLQSLDSSSPRVSTWIVDYATGANPTSFTPLTTSPAVLTTGGSKVFSNTNVTVDFANLIDNINDIVWIRVLTVKRSTGSGNRPSSAIDDWNLSWQELNASVSNIITDKNYLNLTGNLGSTLNVNFNKSIASNVSLQVLSLNGNVVYQKQFSKVTQGQSENIEGLNLSNGIYILKVQSKDGIYTTRLIK